MIIRLFLNSKNIFIFILFTCLLNITSGCSDFRQAVGKEKYIPEFEFKGKTKEEINEENKIKKETVSAEVNTESELIEKEGEKIKEINSMEEEEQAMK